MAPRSRPTNPDEPTEPTDADTAAAEDPTRGGAVPDPNDDSPRGRFNRGEIDAAELNRLLTEGAEG